jgi:two-component system, chemotaxis family, protein-glutamate methylesterase/glutaminase
VTPSGTLDSRIDAVVIGASAGGVEALSVILPAFAAGSRVSVFVVLHVPRERPSLLEDIFSRKCALSVREAHDKQVVEAGTIYFAPPDYHMLIETGAQIALSADDLVNYSRPSIDVLFESAADVYERRLLGIVLTGSNQDGTAGLRAVHRAGGIAIVQDPAEAQAPFMAKSALVGTPSAASLSLAKIAEAVSTLGGPAPATFPVNHHG